MVLRPFLLVLALSTLSALGGVSRPEFSVNLDSLPGQTGLAISPTVKWVANGHVAELDADLEGGVSIDVVDTNALPYSVWGKFKKSVLGWNLAARVDADSSDLNEMAVDLQVTGGPSAVYPFKETIRAVPDNLRVEQPNRFLLRSGIQLKGRANAVTKTAKVSSVRFAQDIEALNGIFTVSPQYNFDDDEANVKLAYGIDGTSVIVDAGAEVQKLTLSKELGANRITPSITTQGDVELEFSRAIDAGGSLTATIKPNDYINLKWQNDKWVANLKAPMEGMEFKEGVKLSVSGTGL